MFDWNEDELPDIIWGDANESDDHIVPYPKGSEENTLFTYGDLCKKQTSQEAGTVVKSSEQKTSGAKNDLVGCKQETNACPNTNEEVSAPTLDLDLWHADVSGQDSMGNKVSSEFPEVTHLGSAKGRLHSNTGLFGNEYEDKESGSFLEYSWANIGNFDDLDRIFRNDDSVLGNGMIGNADELWPSSADVIASPTQSYPTAVSSPSTDIRGFRTSAEDIEVKTEFMPFKSQSLIPECDKVQEAAGLKNKTLEEKLWQTEDSTETTAETKSSQSHLSNESGSHLGDKVNRERKLSKSRKKTEEMSKSRSLQNMYIAWSPNTNQIQQQYGNTRIPAPTNSAPQTFPSSVIGPQRQLVGPESMRYLRASTPFMHSAYGYPAQHFPAMPMLPLIHSEKDQSQLIMAGYDYSPDSPKLVNPRKKLPDAPLKPLKPSSMTPKEKIEKLRRRQQMQAMFAIQQQQQQLGHQVTCTDHSLSHKSSLENQGHDALPSRAEIDENAVKLLPQGLNLAGEEDDSNKISILNDECSLVETIFDQLQGVVGKLEIKTRLCIRDSLFRLGRSALQRQNLCDTSSTNKSSRDEDEFIGNEEMDSDNRLSDTETDTNPIDRTVAHLLFHRPFEPCPKPAEDGINESPISSDPEKCLVQPKIKDCLNSSGGCLSKTSTDRQSNPYQECRTLPPCTSADPQKDNQLQHNQ